MERDKALEHFLSDKYNEDEDYELLLELAMLRDANNEKVRRAAMEKEALKSLLETEIMEVKDLIEHADEQDKLSLIKYLENLESVLKKID